MAGSVHLSDRQREGLDKLASGSEAGNRQAKGDAALSGLGAAVKKLTGAELIGVHDIAPELLASNGLIAGPAPTADALASARYAIAAARAIGRLDLGQAAVVAGARVIAAEDIAGTDDLLARVAVHRNAGLVGDGQSLLVLGKASKPQQPADIDLPAIGPATVHGAAAAGISLIAVEAKRTLLIDRPELVAAAEAAGITIYGLDADG
jgi:DUF1009 family protein